MVFSTMDPLGEEAQIGQSVIKFVTIYMMHFLVANEATPDALGNDKSVFINTPPRVAHRKIGTVQWDYYRTIPVGVYMNTTTPSGMLLSNYPTLGEVDCSVFCPTRMTS